ncbi:MAG: NAD-dependent epimerase/dehydratase family protein [Bacteroidota bacterium]
MKYLITGVAGFIGSHMGEHLLQKGNQVVGIDCFSSYYDVSLKRINAKDFTAKGGVLVEANLLDEATYKTLDKDFDYILHFAAQPGISNTSTFESYLENNVVATKKLLDFALQQKSLQQFINISTSSVYGKYAVSTENEPPQPTSFYGVTKLAAEQLVLALSRKEELNACSLRLFSVYGPRERPDKLYTKLIAAGLRQTAFPLFEGSEKHLRSFTYVGDIVAGIYEAIKNYKQTNGAIINLGNSEERTTQEGISIIESLLETTIQLEKKPPRDGDQLRTAAQIDKAKKLLNYSPETSLKEGLSKQITWFKQNQL